MSLEQKYYITLIDSHIRDYGEVANKAAIHVCEELWKERIPIAGFILKKDSGLYALVGENFARELTKFWYNPCINFDLEEYIKTTQDAFWLVDYEDGDETKPRLMFYSK